MKNSTKSRLRKLAAVSLSLVMMLALSACGGESGDSWYNVYGEYCGGSPGPGCNFYGNYHRITAQEDPYYVATGYYTDTENMTGWVDASQWIYGTFTFTDAFGYPVTYTGEVWESPNGILYDYSGYALNDTESGESRDLIADVAEAENQVVNIVGTRFAQKYSLSEEKGIQIAKTLNEYATLSKKQKRARTDKDVADFSMRLYGVSADKVRKAIEDAKKGSPDQLEALNSDVAVHWGTSPETSKVILKSWYKNQLSELHVK